MNEWMELLKAVIKVNKPIHNLSRMLTTHVLSPTIFPPNFSFSKFIAPKARSRL